jgi:phosphoserine phosphatase
MMMFSRQTCILPNMLKNKVNNLIFDGLLSPEFFGSDVSNHSSKMDSVIGQIIDKPAKAHALSEWANELGLAEAQCVAVGDGANDLDMMNTAGLSVGFNAKPRVRAQADLLIGTEDLRDLIPLLGL